MTVLLVSPFVQLSNPMTSNEEVQKTSPRSVVSYAPHSDININGDVELNATAVGEGWAGDGSSESPFIIEGYEIVSEEFLIRLDNTRYHVKIIDCNFTYSAYAIYLYNVSNVVIENCILNGYNGLGLFNVTGIDVIGCDISVHPEEPYTGIEMMDAIDCLISNCVIQGLPGSGSGIYGEGCYEITVFNNTVFDFDNHGIYFYFCDNDIDILNNTVYWNEGMPMEPCGIDIIVCPLTDIIGNNVTLNSMNGISIQGSDNTTVLQNHITGNLGHGVFVELSDFCVIQENYIEGNGEGFIGPPPVSPGCGVYATMSDYCQVIDNEFWGNALNSITLEDSEFAYVFNNYMNHSYNHGIEVYNSDNAIIEENEIYNSDGLVSGGTNCGILLEGSSYVSLIYNTLGHNSENGITVLGSGYGEVIGNTIYESEYYGIMFAEVSHWNITHNVIYDNGGPGIYMTGPTVDNLIYYNDIGWSGEVLVVDEGIGNYWNFTGVGNWYSDYDGSSTYPIVGSAGEIDYYPSVSLYCGVTTPSEYEVGTTGNTMTWNSSALNPGSYELLIDGISQGLETWDGAAVEADVDDLAVGVYNITLIVYHVSGHWLANQSVLTVVDTEAPTWTVTPQDQTLDYNEALSYQLQASDPSGIDSWAVNDTAQFAISATGLLTNATMLEPGVYYVEVTVTDIESNSVTVTIMITVNEPVPPAPPLDPAMLLAIGGIGAGLVIILVVFMLKKKGS